jgi:VWFA-related protein
VGVHVLICAALILAALLSGSASAQEVADTIRIQTRVVFLDALVKEKKTGVPITSLAPENFEVYDDGKVRPISYFTRQGEARKPLALVLILDLREDGAGRFLRHSEILKAMADELAKLPANDEVAILAINVDSGNAPGELIRDGKAIWLTGFTKDRARIASALSEVPSLIDIDDPDWEKDKAKHKAEEPKQIKPESETVANVPPKTEPTLDPKSADSSKQEVLETKTIKGKSGAVITRTVMKDGSINVKRVSSSGRVTVAINDIYDLSAAVIDATQYAQKERPNFQPSLIWLSDGIVPVFFEDRDVTEQSLIRQNVIFNSLTVELRTLFKFLLPIAKPVGNWVGMSFYGTAKRLALQTGGEAVRVSRPKDYAIGLSKIVGNLTARYTLGFTLEEAEKDDGRLHSLDVRVKAVDEKGKTRKLSVSTRKGYYMSTPPTTEIASQSPPQ